MTDFARLKEKLAKLGQKERAPGDVRKLRGDGADALLAAIVTEIDETILPRRLSFTVPSGQIHLAVANRRLQALLAPAPAIVPAHLVDKPLPDVEEPAVGELGDILKTVLADTQSVVVSAMRLTESFGSDIGVPAEQLPRVWTVAESTVLKPEETLQNFLDGLDTSDVSWLRIEGEEVTGQGGAEEDVARLGEQAAVFLDGYFSKFDVAFREPAFSCATLISPGDGAGPALFFIEIENFSAIVSAPVTRVLSIATTWQSMVAE